MSEKRPETKVRIYPSGMVEVSGGSADEVALIGAEVSKGLLRNSAPNGHSPEEIEGEKSAAKPANHSPFVDDTVDQSHPAIRKLEQHIISEWPVGRANITLQWCREFIGKEITGIWRECRTRAVGTLMTRLTKRGLVSQVGKAEWQKVPQVKR